MKKLLLAFGTLLLAQLCIAQNWAPIGATWYYSEGFFSWNEYDEDYINFESVSDTLIEGKSCRKITKRHKPACNDRPWVEYMYSENGKVYFFDPNFNDFQIIYDFSAEQYDSWTILVNDDAMRSVDTLNIIVDSTEMIDINGFNLKQLYVTYQFIYDYFNEGDIDTLSYQSRIIEQIGDINYMFNYAPAWSFACDGNFYKGIRCYEDTIIGLYETGIADSCDYRHPFTDNIEEVENGDVIIKLFPNPTNRYISINSEKTIDIERIQLFTLSGKEMKIQINQSKIDLGYIPEGIYILKMYLNNNQIINRKIIRQ